LSEWPSVGSPSWHRLLSPTLPLQWFWRVWFWLLSFNLVQIGASYCWTVSQRLRLLMVVWRDITTNPGIDAETLASEINRPARMVSLSVRGFGSKTRQTRMLLSITDRAAAQTDHGHCAPQLPRAPVPANPRPDRHGMVPTVKARRNKDRRSQSRRAYKERAGSFRSTRLTCGRSSRRTSVTKPLLGVMPAKLWSR
jgi:hypothetical protein